jgi:hypothetical protein
MLEYSKNVSIEIRITLLEFKMIRQNCGKIIRKIHVLLQFLRTGIKHVKPNFFQNFLKNLERKLSSYTTFLSNQYHCLELPRK